MIISLVTLVVLIAIVIVIYNGIISRENSVKRAWADVITQERQKNKILPEVEKLTNQYVEKEADIQTHIAALRSSMAQLQQNVPDGRKLEAVETHTEKLLSGLHVAVEAYPELKASDLYTQMMREISEQQENVGAAIRIFNQNVEEFNNGISVFPNNLVNRFITHRHQVNTYRDTQAQSGFDYTPNI